MFEYSDKYENRHALIIGIDNYKNISQKLSNAVNDARALRDFLTSKMDYNEDNISLLLNDKATKHNIEKKLYSYMDNTGCDDSLIIYFAGHGVTRLLNNKTYGFAVPYDGTEQDYRTLLDFEYLLSISRKIKAKHIILILDCCYGGLVFQRGSNGVSSRFLRDLVSRRTIQAITAGKSDQRVTDGSPTSNNSIFCEYLIKALEGEAKTENGVITGTSVINYLISSVGSHSFSNQTPNGGTLYGEGDFVFNLRDFSEKQDSEYSNDILVERTDLSVLPPSNRIAFINELTELMSNPDKLILLDRKINDTLLQYRETSSKISPFITKENFKEYVSSYFDAASNILTVLAMMGLYYEDRYEKIIEKILVNIHPSIDSVGLKEYGDCLVIYAAFLIVTICGVEANRIDLLSKTYKLSFKARFSFQRTSLLDAAVNNTIKHYDSFDIFFPEKNYRYPLCEYFYTRLQPILDDILFMGDSYENKFVTAELIIALFFATRLYTSGSSQVWGPSGRYKFLLHGNSIKDTDAELIARRMGLFKDIDDIDRFRTLFDSFLGSYW